MTNIPRVQMTAVQKRDKNKRSIISRRKNAYWKSDTYKASQRRWRKNNPVHVMLRAARVRARKAGVPFDLEVKDILVPEYCPILGLKLERGNGKHEHASPSIDRKIPELGYVKGNVTIISHRANSLKRNCTDPRELRAVADYIEGCLTID